MSERKGICWKFNRVSRASPTLARKEKETVPSDPPAACFPAGTLGRKRGIQYAGTSALCSPTPLLPGAGSSLGCSSALHPGRSLILGAAFRSSAVMARLAANPHGRLVVPGLHLRIRFKLSQNPFGFPLPALPGFSSLQSAIPAGRPLSCPTLERSGFLRTDAPLQDLSILRAPSTRRGSNRRSLP